MANLNRVFLIGNLTRDPELRYTPNGTAVSNLRIAVNRRYKTQGGDLKEETAFITVVVWAKQAEACAQFLNKGKPVFVEGEIQTRSWESSDGQKRNVLEVRASRVQFLARPQSGETTNTEQVKEKEESLDELLNDVTPKESSGSEGGSGSEEAPF